MMEAFRGMNLKNMQKIKPNEPRLWSRAFFVPSLVIVLALISFGIAIWQKRVSEKHLDLPGTTSIIVPKIIKAQPKELPENFPDFIPIKGKNEIDRAYDASYPNSSLKQGTTILNSQKSQKENYDFYRQWAADNQWEIINYLDSGPVWSLYLRKDNEDINLTFSAGSINISYSKLSP